MTIFSNQYNHQVRLGILTIYKSNSVDFARIQFATSLVESLQENKSLYLPAFVTWKFFSLAESKKTNI